MAALQEHILRLDVTVRMLAAIGIDADEAYSASLSCFHSPGARMSPTEREACADIARRPSHFVAITVLMLAPLAALGLRALLERTPARRRPLLLAAVCGLLALELLMRLTRWQRIP